MGTFSICLEMKYLIWIRDRVKLTIGGICENPLANGEEGVCGQALGAHIHPPPAGKITFSFFITSIEFSLPDHSILFALSILD